jgi:hypothetical protein
MVWKNSIPKLLEVTGGTETNIYCQATICQKCVLAVPLAIKVGLTKVENQEEALKHSEEVVFVTSLEQMFKCMATDVNKKPTTMQQRLTCAQKCQVSAASMRQAIRSSSESTGDE